MKVLRGWESAETGRVRLSPDPIDLVTHWRITGSRDVEKSGRITDLENKLTKERR